jgi:hypothetical protein
LFIIAKEQMICKQKNHPGDTPFLECQYLCPHLSSDSDEVADNGESGMPVVTKSGSVVAPTQVNSKLFVSVGKGKEPVVIIEEMLVSAVGSLNFTIMPGGGNSDEFMLDAIVFQGDIQNSRLVGMEAVGKLDSVVGLDAGDREREKTHHLLEEADRIVAAKLIEDHLEFHAAVLINGRILIEFLPR